MAIIIRLEDLTLAFPAIAEPQSFGEGEPAYGAKFPIVIGSDQQKQIEDAILAEAENEWEDKAANVLAMLAEDAKLCFVKKIYRSKKTGEPYTGFEDCYYLSTRNAKTQPTVVDQYGDYITTKGDIERKAFSGAIVNASLEVWAQDNKWGRRVNCTLRGIMLTGEGKSVGGGSAPAEANEWADLAKAQPDVEDYL